MQATNNIYKEILNTPGHKKEHRVFIGGVEQKILKKAETKHRSIGSAPVVTGGLFSKNHPTAGNCVARQIDLMVKPESEIPRMAEIRLETRLVLQTADGDTLTSEWLPKGTFFIDTRRKDTSSGALVIHGYDAMLKMEKEFLEDEEDLTGWPKTMPEVIAEIAEKIGVELDDRNVLHNYSIEAPVGYTMREVAGWVAAAHAGNWIITDAGKLRLVPLYNPALNIGYLVDESGDAITFGGVRILV